MEKMNDFERMISGKLYNASSKDIEKQHMFGLSQCDKFNRIAVKRVKAKQKAIEKLIPSAKGNSFTAFSPFHCEYGINIKVGKECFANYNCTFLDCAPITLGNSVWVGANVNIVTPMHPFVAEERINQDYPDGRHDLEYALPITIKDNCWICSGATICGGVTIGENSIVAAGAVVTKDMPANSIIGGVPAKVIRQIDENDKLNVWGTYEKNLSPVSKRKGKNY